MTDEEMESVPFSIRGVIVTRRGNMTGTKGFVYQEFYNVFTKGRKLRNAVAVWALYDENDELQRRIEVGDLQLSEEMKRFIDYELELDEEDPDVPVARPA